MSYALGEGTGPLRGVRVVEIAGIGPGPHACMLLADLGADVIRDRAAGRRAARAPGRHDVMNREPARASRSTSSTPTRVRDRARPRRPAPTCWSRGCGPARWSGSASAPTTACARNPALVYGRMTGWGQDGPWAQAAGHDLNYVVDHRRAARRRPGPGPAPLPDQPARRLRRRVDVPRHRRARRAARGPHQRQGPGRRRRDRRRRRPASTRWARSSPRSASSPRRRRQRPARRRHALLRPLRDRRRQARLGRRRSSRSSTPSCSGCSGSRTSPPTATTPPSTPSCAQLLTETFRQRTQAEWAEVFDGTDACVAPVLPLSEAVDPPAPRGPGHLRRASTASPSPRPRPASAVRPARSRMRARRPRRPHPRGAGRVGRRRTSTR